MLSTAFLFQGSVIFLCFHILPLFVQSVADGPLGCFHSLTLRNTAAVVMPVMLLCGHSFPFSWVDP